MLIPDLLGDLVGDLQHLVLHRDRPRIHLVAALGVDHRGHRGGRCRRWRPRARPAEAPRPWPGGSHRWRRWQRRAVPGTEQAVGGGRRDDADRADLAPGHLYAAVGRDRRPDPWRRHWGSSPAASGHPGRTWSAGACCRAPARRCGSGRSCRRGGGPRGSPAPTDCDSSVPAGLLQRARGLVAADERRPPSLRRWRRGGVPRAPALV